MSQIRMETITAVGVVGEQGQPLGAIVVVEETTVAYGGDQRDVKPFVARPPLEDAKEVPEGEIALGPVVGKVTETTARVLVEFSQDVALTVELFQGEYTGDGKVAATKTLNVWHNKPEVFVLGELQPDTQYSIVVSTKRQRFADVGRVRTLPANAVSLKMAVVSGDRPSLATGVDLWQDLRQRVLDAKLQYVLHAGDNILVDADKPSAFEQGLAELKGVAKDEWKNRIETVRDKFRAVYRKTWSKVGTKWVLANAANLFILNDHEIRGRWGDHSEAERDRDSASFFVGLCAKDVYLEYQGKLNGDVEPNERMHHMHKLGQTGLLFIDVRGGRTFYQRQAPPDAKKLLGTTQWMDIEIALNPERKESPFADCSSLVVVSPVPIALLATKAVEVSKNADVADWNVYASPDAALERVGLFNMFRQWKAASKERQLVIVSGDIGSGGYVDVYHGKQLAFKQLVTSPINGDKQQRPYLLKVLSEILEDEGDGFTHEGEGWIAQPNYAVLTTHKPPNSPAEVRMQLVTTDPAGKQVKPQQVILAEKPTQLDTCSNCFGFC